MGNSLAVKVTADIVDAQAKLSILNAEFRATQTQINALARAGAAGNLDTAAAAQLQSLTTRSLELQAAAQPLAVTIGEAGFAVKGLGSAAVKAGESAEGAGVNISSMTRYARELFDEFSSGRTRYVPSTLAELANQGFHLNGAMLAGYGGVAILAAGLVYLAYKGIEAEKAIQGIADSAAFLGNANVNADFAGQLVGQLKEAGDLSESEAEKTARVITQMQNLSQASMSAVAGNIGVIAQGFSTTADKAAETVGKVLDVNTSIKQLQELLPGLTPENVLQLRAVQQTGDYAQIIVARWRALTDRLQAMQEEQKGAIEKKLAFAQSAAGQQDVAGKAELDNSYIYIHQLQEQQQQIERNIALTKEMAANPVGPGAQDNQVKQAIDLEDQLIPKMRERRELQAQINQLEHAIPLASADEKAGLQQALAAAQKRLAELQSSTASGADSSSLQAAEQAANVKHEMAEREISDANRALQEVVAAQREAANQARQVAAEHASAASQIMRIELDARKQTLDAEVASGKISASLALATEKQLTADLFAQDIQRLQNELSTLDSRSVAYARVSDQIKIVKAQEVAELANYDRQIAENAAKEAKKEPPIWNSVTKEIERAEGQLVNNIVSGRRTLGQSLLALGSELVAQEIQQDLKAATTRILLAREADVQKKAIEQGGVLYHLLFETQKTGQTTVAEHARTAAAAAANTARTGAALAAATQQKAIAAATGPPQVMGDAAKAAAGAFSAIVGIPYVGPALAPGAAATAFAQVSAYAPMAALAVGAWDLPQDMLAQLHQGEMVVPKTFAQGMRQNGSPGGSSESHHYSGDVNVNAFDSRDVSRMFKGVSYRSGLASGLMRAYRRGAFRT